MQIAQPGMSFVSFTNQGNAGVKTLVFNVWSLVFQWDLTVQERDLIFVFASLRATLNAGTTLTQTRFNRNAASTCTIEPSSALCFNGIQQERFAAGSPASLQNLSAVLHATSGGNLLLDYDGFVDVGNGSVASDDSVGCAFILRP